MELTTIFGFLLLGYVLGQQGPPAAQYRDITSCPESYGLQVYPNPQFCDQYYKCENGTLTHETCGNGLLFDGKGSVHDNCNYNWAVHCEGRHIDLVPIGRGPCEYAFGLYPAGACETFFVKCAYGEPEDYPCTPGLAYDDRTHGCNWPDLMEACNPEQIVGFKCPDHYDPNSLSAQFEPYPRYPSGDCGRYITCVHGHPRLIGCGDYTVFSEDTYTCEDPEYVPKCAKYFN